MEKDLIVVDKNEITQFTQEGGKLVLKANAEDHLVKLMMLKDLIDNAIEEVKSKIIEVGVGIDPDFKGIVGKQVKAIYRYTDSPYDYDRTNVSSAEPFLKEVKYYKVDGEKIEKYVNEVGELPDGILEKDRSKKLVLSLKESEEL